jgi:quercetin dioxygenase-like cupin family protein
MEHFNWGLIEEEALNPLLTRQLIHGRNITVARIRLRKYAQVPVHTHVSEQICLVEQGALRFVVDGEERIVRAGEALEIPPDAPHLAEALEDSVVIDVFAPRREDWIRGDDAYLRQA